MSLTHRRHRVPTTVAVLAALALAACGGGEADPGTAAATTPPAADAQPTQTSDPVAGGRTTCTPPSNPGPASFEATAVFDPDPPVVEGTKVVVTVTRDGEPVSADQVCFAADMTEMMHAGLVGVAEETAPGRYEYDASFNMRGRWSGAAVVVLDGESVAVPLTADVG